MMNVRGCLFIYFFEMRMYEDVTKSCEEYTTTICFDPLNMLHFLREIVKEIEYVPFLLQLD